MAIEVNRRYLLSLILKKLALPRCEFDLELGVPLVLGVLGFGISAVRSGVIGTVKATTGPRQNYRAMVEHFERVMRRIIAKQTR